MGWISEKIFGKKRTYHEEFASNLYDALVLDGGPSSDADSHIDAMALEIPLDKLERFAAKRRIMLEAFLFATTYIATMPTDDEGDQIFQSPHPLSIQIGQLLQDKWHRRGIEIRDLHDVGERCFGEVEMLFDKPFKWGRAWLDEFYTDPEKSGEHYILWTEQCLNEFETMKTVVQQYT